MFGQPVDRHLEGASMAFAGVIHVERCAVEWGSLVASAFDRHGADSIIAETNFGGTE